MKGFWQRHDMYMMQALKLAEQAYQQGEVPVGALVVKGNVVIGKGYNQTEMLNDPTAHAEMIAISSACDTISSKYLDGCTLYVTLEPCVMCTGALIWAKLDRVVFGAADEKSGACGTLFHLGSNQKLNHQAEIIQGVMEKECGDILKKFFKEKR